MTDTIRFASTLDLKTYSADATAIAAMNYTETTAIVLKDVDIDQSYVTSVGGNTQGTLYINFTKGSLTSMDIYFYGGYEGNPDAASAAGWFSESDETDTSGVLALNQLSIHLTADNKMMFHFPIGACRAYKITVKPSGTATTGAAISLAVGLRSN
jgi:hypothetical protein